ncbi:hypothetical protein AKJ16_DCAP24379 [Drosera capensis]
MSQIMIIRLQAIANRHQPLDCKQRLASATSSLFCRAADNASCSGRKVHERQGCLIIYHSFACVNQPGGALRIMVWPNGMAIKT